MEPEALTVAVDDDDASDWFDLEDGSGRGVDLAGFNPEVELNEPLEVNGVMPLAFCNAARAKGLLGFLLNMVTSFLRRMTS